MFIKERHSDDLLWMDPPPSREVVYMDGIFNPKVGQIGTKSDKSGTFEVHSSVHFGSPSQNVLKMNFKSPRFVLFCANPIHFMSQTWQSCGSLCSRTHSFSPRLSSVFRNISRDGSEFVRWSIILQFDKCVDFNIELHFYILAMNPIRHS